MNLQVGFAEMQIKWIPAEDSNGESGGRPSLPYSQRKLDEVRSRICVFVIGVGVTVVWHSYFCNHLWMVITVRYSGH